MKKCRCWLALSLILAVAMGILLLPKAIPVVGDSTAARKTAVAGDSYVRVDNFTGLLGDLDQDENLSTTDARLILQAVVGKYGDNGDVGVADLTEQEFRVADVDQDNVVTTTDARLLLQAVVEKIKEFPSACQHEETADPAVEATCQKAGSTAGTHCSRCCMVLVKQESLPATDHTYTEHVVAPTCHSEGFTLFRCACGERYKDAYTPKTMDHNFVEARLSKDGRSYDGIHCSECELEVISYGNADSSWFVDRPVKFYIAGSMLDQSGCELVIYGTGDMPDYGNGVYPHWMGDMYRISKVTVTDGITSIGREAFKDKDNHITEFHMGKDVKVLKYASLAGLKLSELRLGESMERIEGGAIEYSNIDRVYWPKTVNYIEDYPNCTIYYQGSQQEFNTIRVRHYMSTISMGEAIEKGYWPSVEYNAW